MRDAFLTRAKQVFSHLRRFITVSPGLKLTALLLSVLMWVMITESRDPVRKKELHIPAQRVEWLGLDTLVSRNLTMVDGEIADILPDGVRVTVSMPNSRYRDVHVESFTAYVDVSRMTQPGSQTAIVEVSLPDGVTRVGQTPDRITLDLDRVDKRSVPVSLIQTGALEDNLWMDAPTLSAASVSVEGAAQDVQRVAAAHVRLDLSTLKESLDMQSTLVLVDDRGGEVISESLKIGADVGLRVTVLPSKIVPIDLESALIGSPARGYVRKATDITARSVMVAAPQNVLDGITSIKMGHVLVEGKKASFQAEAQLEKPAGAVYMEREQVQVSVSIDEEQERRVFSDVRLRVIGLDDGFAASLDTTRIQMLSVTGYISQTRQLSVSDLNLFVDAAGRGPGEYTLPVQYAIPNAGRFVVDMDQYFVRVVITRQE